jgi:aspartate racemase
MERAMKTIGLIGGMSWESTATYYSRLNQEARRRGGGLSSAEILLRSVDFLRIVEMQKRGAWDEAAAEMIRQARSLERGGADMVLICTNTMHKLADAVAQAVSIPLLHIVDTTSAPLKARGLQHPLLLATQYTMEQDFYLDRMRKRHGLSPLVPEAVEDRRLVHSVIFDEICCGIIRDESRAAYRAIIEKGKRAGADSVILGCTEIGLLIGQDDTDLPVFDSTILHADAAIDLALSEAPAVRKVAAAA